MTHSLSINYLMALRADSIPLEHCISDETDNNHQVDGVEEVFYEATLLLVVTWIALTRAVARS